jgi:tRNA(fMet)-specific endonuclease VapC
MKFVLPDTNVLSALFRADDKVVRQLGLAERVLISPVVEGEILGGFRGGTRLDQNLQLWNSLLQESFVERVPLGAETADRYSRIWIQLRVKGTPIPSNDIWIAAQATELGAELLSFDQHFEKVEGLVWTHLNRIIGDVNLAN